MGALAGEHHFRKNSRSDGRRGIGFDIAALEVDLGSDAVATMAA